MDWYYAKHGQQQGPVDTEALKAKLASGELSYSDLVWNEGMSEWSPASTVPELATAPAEQAPPSEPAPASTLPAAPRPEDPPTGGDASAASAGPITGAQALEQPEPGQASGMPQATPGLAVASLVCGILAVLSACCYGLGLIPGIGAVVCGHMQMNRYKEDPGVEAGKGLVVAGLITGYLGLLGSLLMIAYVVAMIFFGLNASPSTFPAPTTP